jgi:fibronectin-binding autotransporter adhesin
MKNKRYPALSLSCPSTTLLGAVTIVLSIIASGHMQAQSTWSGATNPNWNEAGNWDVLPTANTVLNFGGEPANMPTNNDFAGLTTGAINFTNNGLDIAVVGPPAGTGDVGFTLGTLGQSVTLGGNINTTAIASGGTPTTDTINLNLILNANRTIGTNGGGSGTSSHSVIVNGNITETGGARILTKGGNFPSGTLTLAGNNTYTGFTVIETGTVTVSKIADSGDSNLGYGSQITLSFGGAGGTLNYNGSGSTTNRKVQLGSSNGGQLGGTAGGTITASGANGGTGLVFTASPFIQTVSSTAASRTLTLQGSNTDANQISGSIVDVETEVLPAVTTATLVTKSNAGRWVLSGDNSYTGASAITAGNLNIRHANALGSTVAGTTVSNAGAQLEIEGNGISFAAEPLTLTSGTSGVPMLRNISGSNTWNGTITATTVAGTSNLARIQSDAGNFTLAGGMSGAGADNSFVLQGSGNIEVTGVISGAIRLNSGASGAGVRTLSNGNTYSGVTVVGGGVLRLNHPTSIPGGIGLSGGTSNVNLTGGILGLGNGNLTRPLGAGVDQIQITAANSGFAAYGADRAVNLGGASAPVAFGDVGFFFGVTGNPSLVLGAPTATHTLDFQNPVVLSGTKFFRADNGSAVVDARLSGAITGSTSFSKSGAGTLELTNTGNAWTANTFIDSGTLRLGAANVLPSTTLEIKRASGTDVFPTLDLNGFSETIGGLTMGSLTTDATNAGQTVSIVNSAGGSATLTLTGTFLYRAGSVGFENGQATISANLDTGVFNRNLTVNDGADPVDLLISGVISGTGNGFNKAATGTLVISGANTYTGPTSISGGTLRLGANDTLPDASAISLNAATLDASTFTDTAGTLDANNAGATIDIGPGGALAFADSSAINWSDNGGALNITGSVVSGASIRFGTSAGGLTPTQLGQISINGTPGTYTLNASGFLVTGAPDPFLTWSGGASFDADANNDGVENGLAWLLGAANPNVNANSLLPVVTQTGGNLKMTFDMLPVAARDGAQLFIEHSSNLGISDPWTGVLVPDVTGGSAPFSFTIGGTNPLDVEATISSSEAAGGKLFGRLRAVR